VSPAAGHPLAYHYAGRATTAGATFSCQQPAGADPNCYTPAELATAYDIPTARYQGTGQSIAIVDAFGDPEITSELATFDTVFGYPDANLSIAYPDGQPAFDPASADELSWSGEVALDLESAHAIAPDAAITLVVARSDADADIEDAIRYAVGHDLGPVLSLSFGEAESCQAASIRLAEHALFRQATRMSISVFAAAGDTGAAQAACDGSSLSLSASTPAADPYVTSVGATSLTATQPDGGYVSETAWNDAYGASGGGFSRYFQRPCYQAGIGAAGSARGVPDVSYSGDVNNGLLIAWSQGQPGNAGAFFVFGGTSAGAPQWAAITTLADQAAGRRLGLLNPALYGLAASGAGPRVFHDVTTGNNGVSAPGPGGTVTPVGGYPAAAGWDPVTGLGSPDAARLIRALAR
jgi:subtilase family serine protease